MDSALAARHRDKNGEISTKHGNTLIRLAASHVEREERGDKVIEIVRVKITEAGRGRSNELSPGQYASHVRDLNPRTAARGGSDPADPGSAAASESFRLSTA
jgi:hypothetical protein